MDEGQQQHDLGIPGLTDAVEVGRGGFAVVYRCHQGAFGRTVAVKLLRDAINDDDARRRFQRECLAMGMLSGHPNIVTVYDAGFRAAGDPYIVMDFMTGGSLADRVAATGPMPWQDVLHAAVMLLGALHSAHEAGVLHRDIKPENVMRSSYGAVKLTDFGIARLRHGPQTRTEGLTASIPHVAPELIAGAPASVQSDLYAVGSTLFHLLSGEAAFLRATDESILPALQRIAAEPVPNLRHAGIPDEICDVVEHLMHKDPARRPPSARVVGEEIRALQRHFGLPATHFAMAEVSPTAADAAVQQAAGAPAAPAGAQLPSAPEVRPRPKPPPHPDFRPQPPPPPPRRGAAPKSPRRSLRWFGWAAGVAAVLGLGAASIILGRSGEPVPRPSAGAVSSPQPTATAVADSTGASVALRGPQVRLDVASVSASAGANGYPARNAIDQRPDTAWSVTGDGVGESLTLSFGTPVRITRLGLIPGDALVDPEGDRVDHYTQARRVEQVRIRFADDVVTRATFSRAEDWDVEYVDVDVVADEVTLVVLASSSGNEDRVAISEVEVFGVPAGDLPIGAVEPLPADLKAQRLEPAPPPPAGQEGSYAFPVYPPERASYRRGHNAYPASDLYAPCGTAVVAPTAGTVTEVQRVDRWDPETDQGPLRGGVFVTLVGADGVRYFISHLGEIAAGLREGAGVEAGALLGTVGETGTARGTPCHIHLGFSRPGSGPQDWRPRRGEVDPHPYLEAWREGRDTSPADEVGAAP